MEVLQSDAFKPSADELLQYSINIPVEVYLIVDTIQHNSAFNLVLKSWTDLVNNDLEVLKQHSKSTNTNKK